MGNLPEALTRFAELLRLDPRDRQARFEYAGLLAQVGRFDDARHELEQLVAEEPEEPRSRYMLANVLMHQREYELARRQLASLLADPEYGSLAAVREAQSFVAEDRRSEARAVFDKYLRDRSELSVAEQCEVGRLLIDLGRPADAVQLLNPLHERRGDEGVWANLILAYVHLNSRLKALELIDQVESQGIKESGLWFELATQLYDEQAYPEALAMFELVAERFPAEQRAVLYAARTHLRLYEVDSAWQLLTAYKGDRGDRIYSTVLADYHTVVGEYAEAIAIARRRLQDDPHDIEAGILLGNVYHASHQFFMADDAYLTTLARCASPLDPQRREIRRLMARNYVLSRRFEPAIALLNQLLIEHPNDVAARLMLADALTKARRFDAAMELATPPSEETNARSLLRAARATSLHVVGLRTCGRRRGRISDARRRSELLDARCGLRPVPLGKHAGPSGVGEIGVQHGAVAGGAGSLVGNDHRRPRKLLLRLLNCGRRARAIARGCS